MQSLINVRVRMESSFSLDKKSTIASEHVVLWGRGLRGQGGKGAKGQGKRLLRPLAHFRLITTKGKSSGIALLCNKVKLTLLQQ